MKTIRRSFLSTLFAVFIISLIVDYLLVFICNLQYCKSATLFEQFFLRASLCI